MKRIEYATIDKTKWGDGPWASEPDKVQWQDEATGLPCLIRRNARMGNWCGYVGVPSSHPLHGKRYDDLDVDVHGGLTFSDGCTVGGNEATSICHKPEPGEPDDVWWFGFDCGHLFDLSPGWNTFFPQPELNMPDAVYRDQVYVGAECAKLAKQLRDIT